MFNQQLFDNFRQPDEIINPDRHSKLILPDIIVNWNSAEQAFIDSSRGSWFDLYGMPKRRSGVNSIFENHSLPRYDMKIENGLILIDLNRSHVVKAAEDQKP